MPLASGYSWETVHANISHMIAEGFSQAPAVAVSFAAARRSYFKRFPNGLLPMWLSYPRGLRIKEYYRPNGEPRPIPDGTLGTTIRKVAARTVRKNPIQTNQLHKAARLFESFAGKKPTRVKRVKLEPMPKVGLAFGEMVEVTYRSYRDGELYKHAFRPLKSRPLLIATFDGKRMLMLGGAYNFTERGIENAP